MLIHQEWLTALYSVSNLHITSTRDPLIRGILPRQGNPVIIRSKAKAAFNNFQPIKHDNYIKCLRKQQKIEIDGGDRMKFVPREHVKLLHLISIFG